MFKNLFMKRRTAYRNLFRPAEDGTLSQSARIVLKDLKAFCRANTATFTQGDPHTTSLLEGRREVFNRISNYVNMTDEEFARLTKEPDAKQDPEDWEV